MELISVLAKFVLLALFTIGAVLGLIFFGSFFYGFFVWILWDWVVPDIFGLKPIGYFQAVALTILCGILFKSSSSSIKGEKK
jgi:hypothetical protein